MSGSISDYQWSEYRGAAVVEADAAMSISDFQWSAKSNNAPSKGVAPVAPVTIWSPVQNLIDVPIDDIVASLASAGFDSAAFRPGDEV